MAEFVISQRNKDKLVFKEFIYTRDRTRGIKTYWKCNLRSICNGRALSIDSGNKMKIRITQEHTHPPRYQGVAVAKTAKTTNLKHKVRAPLGLL